MRHHAKIGQIVAEIWQFNGFFPNGRRLLSWTCWVRTGTTRDEYLVVSIVVKNLVEIDAVVSII